MFLPVVYNLCMCHEVHVRSQHLTLTYNSKISSCCILDVVCRQFWQDTVIFCMYSEPQITGVLKSSDSGTNFLVPKVNLVPQDWFLEIYC